MTEPIPAHHVYLDEAYLQNEYRVQGGIWVHGASIRPIKRELAAFRARHPWLKEMKWTNITGSFVSPAYLEVLDIFFGKQFADDILFNCIVVKADIDPTYGFSSAARDLGFHKAYWTLLRHRLIKGASHHVTLDQKACKTMNPEATLRDALNRQISGYGTAPAVLSCKSVSSVSDDLLQLADLFCGAVGWAWNNRPSKSEAKQTFAQHIVTSRSGRRLEWQSSKSDWKFNVWLYQPGKRRTS